VPRAYSLTAFTYGVIASDREPAVRTISSTKEQEMARRHLVRLVLVVTAAVCVLGAEAGSGEDPKPDRRDVIAIGHRGASGSRPEHTLAAYRLAIKQCADYIEPDLVSTRDHVLVTRHENDITGTTDVADHPEFADRRTTKMIDGMTITGWFTEDFTQAELDTLRARERIPDVRPESSQYNGRFEVPTLEEVLDLARRSRTCKGKRVGVYPETKHPSYFDSVGLSLEEPLVAALHDRGYRGKRASVYIQSFEVANLQQLRGMTRVRLAQLVNCGGQPWDFTFAGDPRTYADLLAPDGLDFVRTYADAIAVCKDLVIPRDEAGNLATPTAVVADAHARRLVVHPWTFRRENQFLPTDLRRGADPNSPGDLPGEIGAFRDAEIDGFFTDNPDIGRRA
jgi:glycerophosphoryl diester phosphodiesterase